MFDKRLVLYRIKNFALGAAALALTLPMYGVMSDRYRLNREMTAADLDSLLPPSVNDVSAPVIVNVNTASAHQLERLDGIGKTTAAAVVEYREKNGYFRSVEELLNVNGIGSKKLDKIRGNITI